MVIWVPGNVIVCMMCNKSCKSFWYEDIYKYKMRMGVSKGLLNFIICKYGEISEVVGIFTIFFGYAYLLRISVRSPPLGGGIWYS
jgi:hypothetical protein